MGPFCLPSVQLPRLPSPRHTVPISVTHLPRHHSVTSNTPTHLIHPTQHSPPPATVPAPPTCIKHRPPPPVSATDTALHPQHPPDCPRCRPAPTPPRPHAYHPACSSCSPHQLRQVKEPPHSRALTPGLHQAQPQSNPHPPQSSPSLDHMQSRTELRTHAELSEDSDGEVSVDSAEFVRSFTS